MFCAHVTVRARACVYLCVRDFMGCVNVNVFVSCNKFHTIPCVFISVQGSCAVTMATSPFSLYPSFSLSLSLSLSLALSPSLSQAAAASWASGHTRPQPPSHIEHPHPPQSPSNSSFLYCYILEIYRQRFGYTSSDTSMKGSGRALAKAHTPFVHQLTASPV